MAGTAVWLDVLPNLSGFSKQLTSGVTDASKSAGAAAGKIYSGAFNAASKTDLLKSQVAEMEAAQKKTAAAVQAATRQIGVARDQQKSADERVQAAEAKLNEQIQKYGSSSSQALTAQAKLTDARSKATSAANKTADAEKAIKAAVDADKEATSQLTSVQGKLSDAQNQHQTLVQRMTEKYQTASGQISSATGNMGKFRSGLSSSLGSLRSWIGAATGFGASFAIGSYVKSSLTAFSDLAKSNVALQRTMGGTISQVSSLRGAMQLSGVDTDKISTLITRFSKNLGTASASTASAKAMSDKLGVSITDANGNMKSVSDLLPSVADKFASMKDGTEKTALAVSLFGRSGTSLLPFLNQGSAGVEKLEAKAKTLGITLDDSAKSKLISYRSQLLQNQAAMEGLQVKIGTAMLPAMTKLGNSFAKNGAQAVGKLASAVQKLAPFLVAGVTHLMNATAAVVKFASSHKTLTTVVLGTVAALALVFKSFQLMSMIGVVVSGPVGLIVTAIAAVIAIVALLWMRSSAFRNFFIGIWGGIKSAAGAVGSWFAGPFVNFFKSAFTWIGQAAINVGNWFKSAFAVIGNVAKAVWSVLVSVFDGIVNVFRVTITVLGVIFFTPWFIAFNLLKGPVLWLWHNAVEPAFNGIKTVMTSVWNFIKTTVIDAWNAEIRGWGIVFSWLYNTIIKPVWDGIKLVFSAAWGWIKTTIIDAWNREINGWAAIFQWLYNTIIKPVWEGIKTAFSAAWNWIKAVVIDAWNREINGWASVFSWLYNAIIRPVWDGIKAAFSDSWNWISAHVVDPFKAGINAIGQVFSDTKDWIATSWDKIKDAAATPVKWVVQTVYEDGIRAVWNGIAGAVGLDLKLPKANIKFAEGGINPGYAPGVDSVLAMTSPGEAWMVPEWVRAVGPSNVFRWNRLARQSGPAAVRADMGFSTGGVVPHMNGGGVIQSIFDGITGFAEKAADFVGDFMSDPAGAITKAIVDPVKKQLGKIGAGDWGQIVAQMPTKVMSSLVDKAKSMLGSITAQASGGTGGAARWSSTVLQALSMLGQPASWLDTVLRRMNQESGGNPTAVNNWDSNAKAGNPSQGLMQVIPSTFAAYAGPLASAGILNPLANIYAGLNYAIHRYGSLSALNRPGGYSAGGIVPTLYDQGGYLQPGTTVVQNNTGKPELVLTGKQQRSMGRNVQVNVTQNIAGTNDVRVANRVKRDLATELGRRLGNSVLA